MSLVHWNSGLSTPIVVPAPTGGDPDWFAINVNSADHDVDAIVSVGIDFVWGGTTKDYSWVLRNAPVESGSGELNWQVMLRRPTSGSYSVRLFGVFAKKDGI